MTTTDDLNGYPIVRFEGARWERWDAGYEMGQLLARQFPTACAEDFCCACAEHPDQTPDAAGTGITKLICHVEGANDEEAWTWEVHFANGERWKMVGWCDYTGWDCQSGVEWTRLDDAAAR